MRPLVFFLEDDLRQHRAGDVFARARVANLELDALLHHLAKMIEGDITGGLRVVEAPVGVFLDDDRAGRLFRFLVQLLVPFYGFPASVGGPSPPHVA